MTTRKDYKLKNRIQFVESQKQLLERKTSLKTSLEKNW